MIVIIKEKKCDNIYRRGADLFMEKQITLIEALTGLDFVFDHLDGRKVRITSKEVIKHDAMFTAENLGMPFHKKTYQFGNLIFHFKVKFPTELDATQTSLIHEALDSKPLQ